MEPAADRDIVIIVIPGAGEQRFVCDSSFRIMKAEEGIRKKYGFIAGAIKLNGKYVDPDKSFAEEIQRVTHERIETLQFDAEKIINNRGKEFIFTFVNGIPTLTSATSANHGTTLSLGLLTFSQEQLVQQMALLSLKSERNYDMVQRSVARTNTTTQRYLATGCALREDERTKSLLDKICRTRNEAKSFHPFYLVDGPSGSGKTQLPFTFKAAGVSLHHLLMTIDSNTIQEVYEPLIISSEYFLSALQRDIQYRLGTSQLEINNLLGFRAELETVGFVFALLGVKYSECPVWTVANLLLYVEEFELKDQLPIFFLDEVLPLTQGSSELQLARNLLRAVGLVSVLMGTNSCAANFITTATFSRGGGGPWCKLITRFPRTNTHSLSSIGLSKLIETLRDYPNLSSIIPFLEQQSQSCLPWFIELLVSAVNEMNQTINSSVTAVDLMDKMLRKMVNWIFRRKASSRSISFLRAQFCYHLEPFRQPPLDERNPQTWPNSVIEEKTEANEFPSEPLFDHIDEEYEPDLDENAKEDSAESTQVEEESQAITSANQTLSGEDRTKTSTFVAAHFAYLDDDDCSLFINGENLSKNDETYKWIATASFKRAKDDSFLYLMFGDGLNFPTPFSLRNSPRMTTLETFRVLIKDHEEQSIKTNIFTDNSKTVKRRGADLEATAAVATEIASHRGGLGGIVLHDFILQLATELLPTFQTLEWESDSFFVESRNPSKEDTAIIDITRCFNRKKVPYLSSESDSWPLTLKAIEGVYLGELHRTKDQERIDLKIYTQQSPTAPDISAECKNYENNIDIQVLREILARIPPTSWLHLVICTHLQGTYWTKGAKYTWGEFKSQHNLQRSALVKVDIVDSRIILKALFPNSVPKNANKMVLFFPIEDWSVANKRGVTQVKGPRKMTKGNPN